MPLPTYGATYDAGDLLYGKWQSKNRKGGSLRGCLTPQGGKTISNLR